MNTPPISEDNYYDYVSPTNHFVKILNKQGHTETIRYDTFVEKLFKKGTPAEERMHAALGVCGEAGELADAIKKEVVYNREPNRQNIVEELGDLKFYIRKIQNLYGITDQEVDDHNADKLSVRYVGLEYSDAAANARADKLNESSDPAQN
jgi:NTP pyrophosphatase (non-canonical NTP hydrolase)